MLLSKAVGVIAGIFDAASAFPAMMASFQVAIVVNEPDEMCKVS